MELENLIRNNNIIDVLQLCIKNNNYDTLKMLCILYKDKLKHDDNFKKIYSMVETGKFYSLDKIRVLLLCNWCSSKDLCNLWNKMSKGDYTWDNIEIVYEKPYDYYCVINSTNYDIDLTKTILFRMEPNMDNNLEHEFVQKNYNEVQAIKREIANQNNFLQSNVNLKQTDFKMTQGSQQVNDMNNSINNI